MKKLLRLISKNLLSTIVLFFLTISLSFGQAFVTTWKTDNTGTSNDDQITIPTFGTGYDYSVDWGDGNNDSNVSGDITHTYSSAGTYTVSITGDFPRIYFDFAGDREKLLTIEEWGDISWTSFEEAFDGCSNLSITAVDAPDLSGVISLKNAFRNCTTLNVSLNHWDVSNIETMDYVFYGASSFDGNISSWNLVSVTSMKGMFGFASDFNQDISGWNVSNVEDMEFLFYKAESFNQDLDLWNVSSVINMNYMFNDADSFNSDISTWDVSNVEYMGSMFNSAGIFNSDISNWNVGKVKSFNKTFNGAINFNQDISGWDVSSATNMSRMFLSAVDFNQNISGWNVGEVTAMDYMFYNAQSADPDISGWDVSKVANMTEMLGQSGISKINYDRLLEEWSLLTLQNDVVFGANGLNYCHGATGRNVLVSTYNWDIDDGVEDCLPFVTTWKTDNAGTSNDDQITIPVSSANSPNFDVDWGDGNSDIGVTGSITHTYASAGTYTISISGDITGISFGNSGDKEKILTVEQWGDINTWHQIAFYGCTNLDVVATDEPNLYDVNYLSSIFRDCANFNGSIGHWNTSSIQGMQSAFHGATSFDQDINSWDVSNVTTMREMFRGATSFNQDLNSWNVSLVDNMYWMFAFATDFNGKIGDWDVGNVTNMNTLFKQSSFNQDISEWNVTNVDDMGSLFSYTPFNQDISDWDMSGVLYANRIFSYTPFNQDISSWVLTNAESFSSMFEGATAFNQDISGWVFPSATNLGQMFDGATSFNQDLSDWDVSNVMFLYNIFDNSNLSKENYDNILIAWSQQTLQSDLEFGALGVEYCLGGTARQSIIDTYNWDFVGDTENCIVDIPDANFKAALLANSSINTTDDGEITIQEAEVVNNLQLTGLGIADLTGIEAFTDLAILNVTSNSLTDIDVSSNTELTSLRIGGNDISSIDLSQNTDLNDFIITGCPFTDIDVSVLVGLINFTAGDNLFSSIDLSNNPVLENVGIYNQPNLTQIDLRNSNNEDITVTNFSGNSLLTCVNVDNRVFARNNWTNVDDIEVYKLACNQDEVINIPDANFKAALLANTNINSVDDGEITVGEAEAYTGAVVATSSGISDITGIEYFYNIVTLTLLSNNITSLDITNNSKLTFISLSGNQLSSLDVTQNTLLTGLFVNVNNLTSLDVSQNTELRDLLVQQNALTSLDVSALTQLERLLATDNDITTFDLSQNSSIDEFKMGDNLLTSIDLRNGNAGAIVNFDLTGNAGLTCVSVDDPLYFLANWSAAVDDEEVYKFSCDPDEVVNIPDAAFKAALLANETINTTDDGEITYGEAEAFTGTLNVEDQGIDDLTGIEAFSEITQLDANRNNLTSVDLAYNTELTHLFLWSNSLESIELDRNPLITNLNLSSNPLGDLGVSILPDLFTLQCVNCELSELDMTSNPDLEYLFINLNDLTSIDVSQNTLLKSLNLNNNAISSLDLSANTLLDFLALTDNDLTSIDLSANTVLTELSVSQNNLTTLDLTGLTILEELYARENQFTALDLSGLPALTRINVQNNSLTELNVANGNNSAVPTSRFDVTGNTNLTCITVDDIDYSLTNWTNIDDAANFSTDCDNTSTEITAFSFAEETGAATIDAGEQSVTIEVALGSDFTTLTPTFTVSTGATASPESGVAQDFTNGFTYNITAENPTVSEDWTITVLEENTTPTDISLSESAIDENNAENDVVGELSTTDENIGDTYTYSLVAGDGDTDNASFSISGSNLLAVDILDFETKDAYSVRIETNDNRGGTYEKAFAISVNDANDAPSAIEITNTSVDENETPDVLIGDLSSTDQDSGDTHTYSLVSGTGDDDNTSFTIESNSLLAIESFDFESQSSYSVLVRSTDSEGGEFDQAFTIEVQNVNEGIEVISAIGDQSKQVGFTSFEIDLSEVFDDIDGDDLTFDAESGDENVVTIAVSGSTLTITEVGLGDATITVSADDGLGETAEDSFVLSVKEVLSTETEITAFSLPGQTGSADIDAENATISIEVEAGTDITALEPTISISESASISPTGAQDFSSDFVYTVTAEDGETTENWTVTVTVAPFTGTDILTFSLDEAVGFANIDETVHTVEIEVAFGTDVSSLVPTITVSEGATISPASSSEVDFTNTVEFSVTAEDGSTQVWTVSVEEALNDANDILSFVLADQTGDATIDTKNHTIEVEVTFGTDLTDLEPSIVVSENATIDLEGSQDFTSVVIYTVTSESGVAQEWEVNITDALNDENDILSFSLESTDGTIDASAHTVAIELPYGTDITALTPEIEVSENATITPDGAQDFSATVVYTVTSESGDPQEWSVSVSVLENTANDIVAFDLPGLVGDVDIDDVNHTVEATVEFATDLTALEPTIAISEGATLDLSGPQDFSSDVTYTIISESGDAQQWVVSVRNAANDQAEILSFEITGQVSSSVDAANKIIDVIMPAGTDVTALSASITISENATISPDPSRVDDYSSKVVFSVTAENGNVKDWTVRVEAEAAVLGTSKLVEVSLYPNPFVDVIKIDGLNKMVSINIIDMQGKVIYEEAIERESVSIDLSKFNSGTYSISIMDQNKNIIYSSRLIKSN